MSKTTFLLFTIALAICVGLVRGDDCDCDIDCDNCCDDDCCDGCGESLYKCCCCCCINLGDLFNWLCTPSPSSAPSSSSPPSDSSSGFLGSLFGQSSSSSSDPDRVQFFGLFDVYEYMQIPIETDDLESNEGEATYDDVVDFVLPEPRDRKNQHKKNRKAFKFLYKLFRSCLKSICCRCGKAKKQKFKKVKLADYKPTDAPKPQTMSGYPNEPRKKVQEPKRVKERRISQRGGTVLCAGMYAAATVATILTFAFGLNKTADIKAFRMACPEGQVSSDGVLFSDFYKASVHPKAGNLTIDEDNSDRSLLFQSFTNQTTKILSMMKKTVTEDLGTLPFGREITLPNETNGTYKGMPFRWIMRNSDATYINTIGEKFAISMEKFKQLLVFNYVQFLVINQDRQKVATVVAPANLKKDQKMKLCAVQTKDNKEQNELYQAVASFAALRAKMIDAAGTKTKKD